MNRYVRPRRTFSTVELDPEAHPQADTDNTRRPVHTERLNWLPRPILATDLPSIRRLTTEFHPRFGSLETIRRPVDRASAVPIETAYIRPRIRTILHVEMYFDFMASNYAWNGFWPMWRRSIFGAVGKRNDAEMITGVTRSGLTRRSERINRSSSTHAAHIDVTGAEIIASSR